MKQPYEYYKVRKERVEYLGIRHFKMSAMLGGYKVIQVCTNPGEVKRGKGNTFGIYLIDRLTFLSNYISTGYAISCTKNEYDRAFKKVLSMLV